MILDTYFIQAVHFNVENFEAVICVERTKIRLIFDKAAKTNG